MLPTDAPTATVDRPLPVARSDNKIAYESQTQEQKYFRHSTAQEKTMDIPVGPVVHFEPEILNFYQITERLIAFERRFGYSTMEMYQRHLRGELEGVGAADEWVGLWFLYFGTPEVKRFACP